MNRFPLGEVITYRLLTDITNREKERKDYLIRRMIKAKKGESKAIDELLKNYRFKYVKVTDEIRRKYERRA